jgi:hypothetical protein
MCLLKENFIAMFIKSPTLGPVFSQKNSIHTFRDSSVGVPGRPRNRGSICGRDTRFYSTLHLPQLYNTTMRHRTSPRIIPTLISDTSIIIRGGREGEQ